MFLSILDRYKERLWLPHQVAKEFMRNRINIIEETIEKYKAQENSGDKFVDELITELRLDKSDEEVQKLRASIFDLIDRKRKNNIIVQSSDKDIILDKLLCYGTGTL